MGYEANSFLNILWENVVARFHGKRELRRLFDVFFIRGSILKGKSSVGALIASPRIAPLIGRLRKARDCKRVGALRDARLGLDGNIVSLCRTPAQNIFCKDPMKGANRALDGV